MFNRFPPTRAPRLASPLSPKTSPKGPKMSPDPRPTSPNSKATSPNSPRKESGQPQRNARYALRRASTLPEASSFSPPTKHPLRRRSSTKDAAKRHSDWHLPWFDWGPTWHDRVDQNEKSPTDEHDQSPQSPQGFVHCRNPLAAFRSISPCLSSKDEPVESEPASPEVQKTPVSPEGQNATSRRRSSLLVGMLSTGQPSNQKGAVEEKPFLECLLEKFRSRRSAQQATSPQSPDSAPYLKRQRSDSECLEDPARRGRKSRSRRSSGADAESWPTNRYPGYPEEPWDNWRDGMAPRVARGAGGTPGIESSKRWRSPAGRFVIPNYGRTFSMRSRPWETRMAGRLRRGGYLPVRPYWVPHQYRYRAPPRQTFAQLCTCYSSAGFRTRAPPHFPPSAPSGRAWRTPAVQQATPCKACEAMRCRVLSQRHERGLRERLRAEERIKHLEEEMTIHERSRQEEIVRQEETREAEETARLERELLLGELWRRSTARDNTLGADTAGKDGVNIQGPCRVLEDTRLNDGGADVSGRTASDRVFHLILEPSDTKSEALLMECAVERQQREEPTAFDDAAADNRPIWYRARCSAGEIQEFDKEVRVDICASVPTRNERLKRGGIFSTTAQEKTTTHHSGLDISFAKEFAWKSDFVLSPSESGYSEKVTRSAHAIRKTSMPSLRHAGKAPKEAPSGALKDHGNQYKQDQVAHLDKQAPAQASKSAEGAKVVPEKSKKLKHHRTPSHTASHDSSGGADKLLDARSAASEEQKTVDAECRTRKSTVLLSSSIDDSKWVARETGEPIHHDAQTCKEEALIAKSASLARGSGTLSSGLYATAAEEPAAQATKTEARAETATPKEDRNDVASAVPPARAATAAENKPDDDHGGVSAFSDLAVMSKLATMSPDAEIGKKDSRDASAAGDSASRRRLVSPPPPVQARAVESPPVPVTVFSGRGILLIVAGLLILWLTIIIISIVVITHNGHTSETSEYTGSVLFTTDHSKATSASHVYLCDTEPCLREGAYLNRLLSDDTHPCTNFYKYVCERWSPERAATNLSSRRFWSRDIIIEAEMEDESVKFITSNPEHVRPVQALLQACNDHPLASSAMAELRKLFQQWNIDEWPLSPYSTRPREDVWTLAGDLLRDLGLAALVDIFPARDPNDDRRALIAIDLPEPLHFPRGDVAGTQLVRAAVKEALHLFDVIDVSVVDRFADDVVPVFAALEVLYPSVTRDEAEVSNLSEVDAGFRKLINRAILGNGTNADHLEGNARILLLDSSFAKVLPGALEPLPTQAILNHLVLRALVRLAAFLPDSMISLRRLSFLETAGRSEKPEPLSLCLRTLERAAPSCFFRALAQPPSSTATLRRHWLSDLETVLLRALPRLPWLDALSSTIVTERLRLLRIDASFIGSARSDVPCAASDVRVLRTPIAALVEVFRRRPLQSLASWWRRALPLGTWPTLDLASGRAVRVPPGLINGSVPANGSLLFAFHLARVAVRLYAALVPVLHAKTLYDRSLPLTEQSERDSRGLLACVTLGEWRQWAAPEGSSRSNWLRRWLLEQTLALELGLHSFRELSAAGRVWKLDPRYANLADVTSTQLFFVYYALDHCERQADEDAGDERMRRELLLRRRLPSAALVNLPLRNMPAFTDAFGCIPGDYLTAQLPCRLFRQ